MKYSNIIIFFGITSFSILAQADFFKADVGFKAPAIAGKSNASSPELGAIVLDSSTNTFYGNTSSNPASPTWVSFGAGAGVGTVTSVAASGPSGIATWSAAVTSSGTLTQTLSTQTAGTFLAGPTSGSAAAPTFRALQAPTISKATTAGTGSGTGGFISGTYTTPAGALYIRVRMVGGGGGGSGSNPLAAPVNGGNTTFGTSLLAANGGAAGGGVANGGSASLGTGPIGTALTGGFGGGVQYTYSSGGMAGGTGGASAFGGNGGAGTIGGAGIAAPSNTGGGGGGGGTANNTGYYTGGGGGAGGFVDAIIVPTAGQVFPYVVGTSGTGGTANSPGFGGGAGGSGYIEVTEYYQ